MNGLGIQGGIPLSQCLPTVQNFLADSKQFNRFRIIGVTRDANGNVLGNCSVYFFKSADESFAGMTTSDSSGNYAFEVSQSVNYFGVAYKVGPPDVAGSTINTLTGV